MQEQQKAVSHAEEEGGGGVAEQCVEEREGGGRGAAPSKIITPNDLLLRTHGGTRATAKSSLPLYVDQSLMSDYLYPVAKLFSESPPSDVDEEEGGVGRHVHAAGHTSANLEVILNNDVDDEEVHLSDHEDDSSPQSAAATAPESTSFFGTAASTLLLLNTKANIPNNLFSRPSFFDNDSGDDEDDTEDPIYLRVEQNKVNPPAPRSSQQSLFQSGEWWVAVVAALQHSDTNKHRIAHTHRIALLFTYTFEMKGAVLTFLTFLKLRSCGLGQGRHFLHQPPRQPAHQWS